MLQQEWRNSLFGYCLVGGVSQTMAFSAIYEQLKLKLDADMLDRLAIPETAQKPLELLHGTFLIRQMVKSKEIANTNPIDSKMLEILKQVANQLTKMFGRPSEPIYLICKRQIVSYSPPSIYYTVAFRKKFRTLLVLLTGTHHRNIGSPIHKTSRMSHFEPHVFGVILKLSKKSK